MSSSLEPFAVIFWFLNYKLRHQTEVNRFKCCLTSLSYTFKLIALMRTAAAASELLCTYPSCSKLVCSEGKLHKFCD